MTLVGEHEVFLECVDVDRRGTVYGVSGDRRVVSVPLEGLPEKELFVLTIGGEVDTLKLNPSETALAWSTTMGMVGVYDLETERMVYGAVPGRRKQGWREVDLAWRDDQRFLVAGRNTDFFVFERRDGESLTMSLLKNPRKDRSAAYYEWSEGCEWLFLPSGYIAQRLVGVEWSEDFQAEVLKYPLREPASVMEREGIIDQQNMGEIIAYKDGWIAAEGRGDGIIYVYDSQGGIRVFAIPKLRAQAFDDRRVWSMWIAGPEVIYALSRQGLLRCSLEEDQLTVKVLYPPELDVDSEWANKLMAVSADRRYLVIMMIGKVAVFRLNEPPF